MEKPKQKYKQIFNNFKKNNTPLPKIQLKINQHSKDIEKILSEMDKNYAMIKHVPKMKKRSENRTRNKKPLLKEEEARAKIDFGPVTYLTYKENIEDDLNLRRYNFEYLRQKIINSKNFRIGYFDTNYKNMNKLHLKNDNKKSYSERKENKSGNRLNINIISYENNKKNFLNNKNNKEIKYNMINENSNILENDSNINRDLNNIKSSFNKLKKLLPINDNTKEKTLNENDIIFNRDNNTNLTSRNSPLSNKNNSLTTRTNLTNYSSLINTNNKNFLTKHSITNYLDKKKPIDLKEIAIHNKSKTSSNFNDYKDLFKYYRTNNNFLNISNANINTCTNNNIDNNQINPFLMLNEQIGDINDMAKSNGKYLNRTAKKKLNLRFIEKLIKKNVFNNSIIELLTNGKKRKIKLRTNFNKIKKQVEHLSIVDKVEKYSDSIPSEKLKTFNRHYNTKCQKIGISGKSITLRNGKIYQQSKSDSKKLSMKISRNCDEIYKLIEQILIDKYYFEERDSKCNRLMEKIKQEKIDLSVHKK